MIFFERIVDTIYISEPASAHFLSMSYAFRHTREKGFRHVLVSCPGYDVEKAKYIGARQRELMLTELIGWDADMIE